MLKYRKAIAIAALLALPAAVIAQTVVQDGAKITNRTQADGTVTTHPIHPILVGGMNRTDSTMKALTLDSDGYMMVTQSAPEQTFLVKHTNILQNTLYHTYSRLTGGTLKQPQADSSAAVSTLGCNRLALCIRYTLDDSTAQALLMVQVRGHYATNTDSSNTFIWRTWNHATAADTIGDFTDRTFNALIDTAAVASGAGERPVWLSNTNPFRALWIPLENATTERGFAAPPYVSVRVRVKRVWSGASLAELTGTAAPPTFLQVDLVGWR